METSNLSISNAEEFLHGTPFPNPSFRIERGFGKIAILEMRVRFRGYRTLVAYGRKYACARREQQRALEDLEGNRGRKLESCVSLREKFSIYFYGIHREHRKSDSKQEFSIIYPSWKEENHTRRILTSFLK